MRYKGLGTRLAEQASSRVCVGGGGGGGATG